MNTRPATEEVSAIVSGLLPSTVMLSDETVKVNNLDPQLKAVIVQAGQVHAWLFRTPLVVTSGNDGHHAVNSAHFAGRAVDLRTKDKSDGDQFMFLTVLNCLAHARGCGVYDERNCTTGPHYHVERFVADSAGS